MSCRGVTCPCGSPVRATPLASAARHPPRHCCGPHLPPSAAYRRRHVDWFSTLPPERQAHAPRWPRARARIRFAHEAESIVPVTVILTGWAATIDTRTKP